MPVSILLLPRERVQLSVKIKMKRARIAKMWRSDLTGCDFEEWAPFQPSFDLFHKLGKEHFFGFLLGNEDENEARSKMQIIY